jgi:hypothetical protein
MKTLGFASVAIYILSRFRAAKATEADFDALIASMESDAIELARQVELLYQNRCNEVSLRQCARGNYDECTSLYPNQTCPGGQDLNVAQCGDGVSCASLWDYSVSNTRLHTDLVGASGGNPSDPNVIETVCFTQQLDEFFIRKRAEQKPYWDRLGLRTPQMYFGSQNGAFRIYPARQSETCGAFDPRVRPWYIAASSGPKNVVLVLDTSGSMTDGNRLALLKQAATQVVETLTVGDRVAIVEFSSQAALFAQDDQFLFTATKENKDLLVSHIDSFTAVGATNFLDAFTVAFAVLNDSIDQEFHVGCTTAILFLTDGEMTQPENVLEADVLDFINAGISDLEARLGRSVFLFTFSISDNNDVHAFPKQIACSTGDNGIWSKIVDEREIFDSLTSYYRLLAIGLGRDENEDFSAWVEPYRFDSGEILGTTVSAPVYDRSLTPNLFLGVVGVDFPLTAVDRALGVPDGSEESLNRIVRRSSAVCPTIDLALCELESFRRSSSAGDGALCTTNCTASDYFEIEEQACALINDYPHELFIHNVLEGLSYEERVCCVVGETTVDTANQCGSVTSEGAATGLIVGISVAGVFLLLLIAGIYCKCFYGKKGSFRDSHKSASKTHIEQSNWDPAKPVNPIRPGATSPQWVPPTGTAPVLVEQ